MSLLEEIKLVLHYTRRSRAPFCLRWKVTEKAWNDHCADRECELRFARAIREAVSLGQSGFARVGGFGFAGEMREPALRRRAGWTRCPQRGHTFCPKSLSQQIACTKNMATRKGWPCRFYLQEIFCVRGVLSHVQSCAPSRFHTLERSRFPHSRVRAFVLVYSPVRITTCGNSSGGTEQRLERANSCRRQR